MRIVFRSIKKYYTIYIRIRFENLNIIPIEQNNTVKYYLPAGLDSAANLGPYKYYNVYIPL